MRRPFARFIAIAALVAFTGCDQEVLTSDDGTPAQLGVRAYVDANGTGAFEGSDPGISGATITLSGEGSEVTATTDGAGLASFVDIAPGSYQLSISGAIPSGAILVTATSPVVVAPFRGGLLSAEFRFANLPGTVGGRVFRDDNDNGVFDAGTDLVAAGIPVALSDDTPDPAGGPSLVEIATTTTDANGEFSFTELAPGNYTVDFTPLATMTLVGGNTQAVTLAADESAFLDVEFTGVLLISVAEARAAPGGQTVTVEGVVTWQAQWDSRLYFFQDATGGLSVFDGAGPTLAIGDSVQITGTRGSFRGEVQIGTVITLNNAGAVGAPAPRGVTAAEINAGTFAGQLVTIDGTVTVVDSLSFGNQSVTLTDAAGTVFTVFGDSRTGVTVAEWVGGSVHAVTGVLGTDDRNTLIHRVEVRMPSDIVLGGSIIDIATARGMDGATVKILGVVTEQNSWDDRVFFIQDATGGISSFFSAAPTMQRGDLVQIEGDISTFRGETQISPSSLQVLGNVAVPSPRGLTGAQVNTGVGQGELVTVTGVLQSIDTLSFGNQLATIRDAAGTDFSARVDSRSGMTVADWPVAGSTVRVTGVLGSDDRDPRPDRIELRDVNDLAVTTAGQVSIAEARSLPLGTMVTVEGTVTWQTQWDSRVYFFQDGTGGISTFDGAGPTLAEGDLIRVSGDVAAFRGETQVGSITATTVVSSGAAPAARAVTGAQINSGLFQGQLVTGTGTLQSVVELSFGNQLVTVRDAAGVDFPIFVDSRNGMVTADWPTIGVVVEVSGVLGFDDRTTVPEGTDARIEVRSTADLVVPPPPLANE